MCILGVRPTAFSAAWLTHMSEQIPLAVGRSNQSIRAFKLTRSGSLDPNPMTFIQTAGVFSSSVLPGTTLVTARDELGLAHYLLTPNTNAAPKSALLLAQSVAARAEEVEELPWLAGALKVSWMITERKPALVSRDTQAGTDPAAVSRALAISMRPGQWVAAVMRRPTVREKKWQLTWLASQLGSNNPQYHSRRSEALVTTFYAGADTKEEADQLLREVAAAMPGFDMGIRTATSSRGRDAAPVFGLAALTGVAGYLLNNSTEFASEPYGMWAMIAAGVLAAASLGLLTGHLPGAHTRFRRRLAAYRLPVAPTLTMAPQRAQAERVDSDGKFHPARNPGYAFVKKAFLVGQEIPVSIVAPHAGSASGEQSTQVREAPASMNQIIGPRIGKSLGRWVALSAKDLWQGIMLLGVPGSGKSVALRNIWAWMVLERIRPSGRDGFPGVKNVLIALETKGEGAGAYKRLAETMGDTSIGMCDLMDENTFAIDMFPRIGSLDHQARTITNAMRYVWGEQSIGSHSFNMLNRVFTAALVVTPAIAAQAVGVKVGASPFYYANILLGGYGDDPAQKLADAIRSEAERVSATEDDDLGFACLQLATLFGPGVTPSQRKTATEAPRNKAAALLSAENWWARPAKVSWDQVLQGNWGVIVNVGPTQNGAPVDKQLKEDMVAMLMFSLYDAIQRNCVSWESEGRRVSIFSDELTEIAGNSPEIVEWMKDKGRSFGIQPVFATQRAGQLDPAVRESVLGFGTLLAYTQDVPDVADKLVRDFSADGSTWSSADIVNLPRYEAIVRTRMNGVRQPAFTVKLANFEADMTDYVRIQQMAAAEVDR